MRVLVGTNYEADMPGTEAMGYLRAFKSLGHEAEFFYYRKKSFFYTNFRRQWVRRMNERMLRKVKERGTDLLLIIRGGYVSSDAINRIRRETSCRTVNSCPDNPFGLPTYRPLASDAIAAYDIFLTKDPFFWAELRAQGYSNVRYLPHGFDDTVYRRLGEERQGEDKYSADVGFVGSYYPYRAKLLDRLVGPEVNLKIWGGRQWREAASPWLRERYCGGPIFSEEKVKMINFTKINLNPQHPGGAVFTPDERVFQIAGCGAFQLVNKKRDLSTLFKENEEIVAYGSREELKDLIDYYVNHPDEREEVAAKSLKRARAEHTHRHRAMSILEILERGL